MRGDAHTEAAPRTRREMTRRARALVGVLAAALLLVSLTTWPSHPLAAQASSGAPLELTLERMVELALNNSYRVRDLNLDVERTRLNLQASRARLRSRVDLDFALPTINHVSETRWDPDLLQNVIQRENSRRLEAELSVRQPVILLGYPTNGYLSLNTRLYRLNQRQGDVKDVRYYNRSFVSYTQPFFQANELKNDLEEAELDFEDQELEFYDDVVGIVDFELFEIAYEHQILEGYVGRLAQALTVAEASSEEDTDRAIDADQIRVSSWRTRGRTCSPTKAGSGFVLGCVRGGISVSTLRRPIWPR